MNLCFKVERSRKSVNFILLSSVSLIVAIVTTNSSTDKVPEEKACALRIKTHKKMIVLDAEMARVASIERGTCVCLFHWHQLRARNNRLFVSAVWALLVK